ncbi:Protein of unknown function, partial [Gryllus bimaculatus]
KEGRRKEEEEEGRKKRKRQRRESKEERRRKKEAKHEGKIEEEEEERKIRLKMKMLRRQEGKIKERRGGVQLPYWTTAGKTPICSASEERMDGQRRSLPKDLQNDSSLLRYKLGTSAP